MKSALSQLALLISISMGNVAAAAESKFICVQNDRNWREFAMNPFAKGLRTTWLCHRYDDHRFSGEAGRFAAEIHSESEGIGFPNSSMGQQDGLIDARQFHLHCQTGSPLGTYTGSKAIRRDEGMMLSVRDARHPDENGCVLFSLVFDDAFEPGKFNLIVTKAPARR